MARRVPSSGQPSGSRTEPGARSLRHSAESPRRIRSPRGRAQGRGSQAVSSAPRKWLSNPERTACSASVRGTAGLREQGGLEDCFKALSTGSLTLHLWG